MAGFSMPHPGWVAIGIVMIGIGIWLIRWANRNNMIATMTDATTEAAISAMRKHGRPDMPSEIKARLDDVTSEPTVTGKTKKVARYAVRHAFSQVFGVTGFVAVVAGVLLTVLGFVYG
ncbi:MAG: hypothetical protein IPL91_09610 [Hyphomicrobium sp.]|nr:hypothetical protein [Hyphomicrobium sp.]